MALTSEQQGLLDAIVRVLDADPDVRGAWLGGSLGKPGGGDAFSDVDVLVLVDDPAKTGPAYVAKIPQIAEPVLVTPMYGGQVINVVTADWGRFDLDFAGADSPKVGSPNRRLIFNRSGREVPAREPRPYRTTPEALRKLVDQFFRVLGCSVVVIGREEWIVGLTGADMMRQLTLGLMLEENGYGPMNRGGMLHRGSLLTAEQRAELEAMTPVAATRDGQITALKEMSAVFLPLARRLAAEVGMEWPAAFEAATRAHLIRHLDLELP